MAEDRFSIRRIAKRTLGPSYFASRRAIVGTIERRLGVETATEVALSDLGLAQEDRVEYEPSGWRDLRRILGDDEVSPDDVFIDFGSGKGRIVLEAARYPFARVIGVEISDQLNAVAQRNVDRRRHTLSSGEVQLVTSDATEYEIPDDVSVVYLFNPFKGSAFQAVVNRLLESVDRRPRLLRLIYRSPVEESKLVASGRFKLIKRRSGLRPGRQWRRTSSLSMYVVLPSVWIPAEATDKGTIVMTR
jgi:SAM-dependent methyltransferase